MSVNLRILFFIGLMLIPYLHCTSHEADGISKGKELQQGEIDEEQPLPLDSESADESSEESPESPDKELSLSANNFENPSPLSEDPTEQKVKNEDNEAKATGRIQLREQEKSSSKNENNIDLDLPGILPRLRKALVESQKNREVQVPRPKPLKSRRLMSNNKFFEMPIETSGGFKEKSPFSSLPTVLTPSSSSDQNNYLELVSPSSTQNREINSPLKMETTALSEEPPQISEGAQTTLIGNQNNEQVMVEDETEFKKIYDSNEDKNDAVSRRGKTTNEPRTINDPTPEIVSSPAMEKAAAQLTEFDKVLRFQNSAKVIDVPTLVSAVAKLSSEELAQVERYVRKLTELSPDSPLKPLFSVIEFMLQNQELMRSLDGNLPPSIADNVTPPSSFPLIGQIGRVPGAFVAGLLDVFAEAGHSGLEMAGSTFKNTGRVMDIGFENLKDLTEYLMQMKEKFPIIGDAMLPMDDVIKILINTSHAAVGDTLEAVGNSLNEVAKDGRKEAELVRQKRRGRWPLQSNSVSK